jgi:hypothetical protein
MSERYFRCAICGEISYGWGHNPTPLRFTGRACDCCQTLVIQARILNAFNVPVPGNWGDEE